MWLIRKQKENTTYTLICKLSMKASLRQSKKIHQMMKECKGEFLYFEKIYLNFDSYITIVTILFFDDNNNNNTFLVLKYKAKKPLYCIKKKIKNR